MRRPAAVAAVLAFAACSSASPPGGGVAGHAGGQSGQGGKAGKGGAGGKAGAGGAGTAGSGGTAGAGGGGVTLGPGACGAGWPTFAFTGTVTDVPAATPPLPVSIGQTVTGQYCFDPAGGLGVAEGVGKTTYLFDTDTSLQRGLPSPAFALTLSAGDLRLATDPDDLGSYVTVTENGPNDSVMVSGATLLVGGSPAPDSARRVDLIAISSVTSVLADLSLPPAFDPKTFATHVINVQVATGVAFGASWETLTRVP